MSLACGIVGLPNVGKSLLFKALTKIAVPSENYPFCTIDPNLGRVFVPDERLKKIHQIIKSEKVIQTSMDFIDIAGLVKDASKGEGLGNQFLGHIRQVEAIVHVLRCFKNDDVHHVHGEVNPVHDMAIVNMELCLSDLDLVERKILNLDKTKKSLSSKDLEILGQKIEVLKRMKSFLEEGIVLKKEKFSLEEVDLVKDLNLITLKKTLYLCNAQDENPYYESIYQEALLEGSDVLSVNIQLEAEVSELEDEEEKNFFLQGRDPVFNLLVRKAYDLLNLQTFFTAGPKELRAWSMLKGLKAPQVAGLIHSDFEKGFICAEVYSCEDLFQAGSYQKIKDLGKLKLEGKEYLVQDGDICHFRFNV